LPEGLDFRILGPLEVRDGERTLRLGGAKQRSVLAILLLHAGEVVSVDRLIDELWADDPPEDAQTALHQHVSRLRKLLEPHRVVVTRTPGYVVEAVNGELDLHRFERLRDEGRAALAAGRPQAASETLRQALALWRGRPLADLEHEPFAREATAALDEAWLAALESRIEADLALGRHTELVGELRALVRRHPLRERLRAQLMLALYRSGRQSEALEAYADARRTLVEELGLEPGPEIQRLQRAILEHDPALEPASASKARSRRRLAWVAAAAAAVAVAAGVLGAAVLGREDSTSQAEVPRLGGELIALDPGTGRVARRIPAGRTPAAVAVYEGRAWLVDADALTLMAVDLRSGAVETLATGAAPIDVGAGAGSVWVANGRRLRNAVYTGPLATSLAQIDPATRTARAVAPLRRRSNDVSNRSDDHVAVSGSAVWAVTPDYAVVRIDPTTAAVTHRYEAVRAVAVAAGEAGVWALAIDGTVVRLDERTGRVRARTRVPTGSATAIAVGRDAVWVTSTEDGSLWRVDAGDPRSLGSIDLDAGITDVAVSAGAVWVVNPLERTVVRVDPSTASAGAPRSIGAIPRAVAADGEAVWVAASGGAETAVTARADSVTPLPASRCERVATGPGGKADVLVVSDLPLQGGEPLTALQMSQAIRFILDERGFRAGRLRVGYQSCDDSLARSGLWDPAKCADNAQAYGADRDVIGVIGTLNSGCAVAALPVLNRAPGGGLAMVSPLNSRIGLTRPEPGDTLPAALYPTGLRTFARVYPTDDMLGVALAMFARERARRRVFVLDDGYPRFGGVLADRFESAARRLGLEVVGRASWDPHRSDYRRLAREVANARPNAVFLAGVLDNNGARMIRDLRERLGRHEADLYAAGFTPVSLLAEQAGPAARGVFVAPGGLVVEHLPPAGARFVERFVRAHPGEEVEPSAVYAAQATTVLLDAIARSDGTRRSVVREVFRTRVTDGLLGTFGFDRNGDISESRVAIVRVRGGGTSRTILSVDGAAFERVVRLSPELLATTE
jgi:DNA-binding SARP family transcriptional activator/ABC-type branched-subunit amino acid transport system substrate-binding protein